MISERPIIFAFGSVAILLILNSCGRISLNVSFITNPVYYMISSCAGFILTLSLYFIVPRFVIQTFMFLGQKTVPIVLLHFLCFKVVTFIYILYTGIDMRALAAFPVLSDNYLWPAYTVAGVEIPVFTTWLFSTVRNSIIHKKA